MKWIPFFLIVFFSFSCEKPTDPNAKEDPKPETCLPYSTDNRDITDYTWQFDTVGYLGSDWFGVDMWVFSDSDVFVMGELSTNAPEWKIIMGIRWNGKKWTQDIYGQPLPDIKHYSKAIAGTETEFVSVGYWAIGNEKMALGEFNNQTKKWNSFQYSTPGWLFTVWTDKKGYYIAGGSNGVFYEKKSPGSSWTQFQGNGDYAISKIIGISANEWYFSSSKLDQNNLPMRRFTRYFNGTFQILYDSRDTTGKAIQEPDKENEGFTDFGLFHCPKTDSLFFILTGWNSIQVTTDKNREHYTTTSLRSKGLFLKDYHSTGLRVDLLSPSDYYVYGTNAHFYHWTGTYFHRIFFQQGPIPFPDDQYAGNKFKRIKTRSGKVFWLFEVELGIYVVAQGTPKT